MAATPFVETEALLALMGGDEDEALRLLDGMLPGERRQLVRHASRLSELANDEARCPGCGKPDGTVWANIFNSNPMTRWHTTCLDADRAAEKHSV